MRIRLLFQSISAWGKRHPALLNTITATSLGGIGDLAAQTVEGADEYDIGRTGWVSTYYAGAAFTFWTPLFAWNERTFGARGMRAVLSKVAVFNIAAATVDIVGFHLVAIAPRTGIAEAMKTLQEGYSETLVTGLA